MKTLLAVDPGADMGWAAFQDGELVACGLVHSANDLPFAVFDDVVIEKPTVYPRSPCDPNDLITLAVKVGEVVNRFRSSDVTLVEPRSWKGQVDKKIHNRRVMNSLSAADFAVANACLAPIAKGKHNNVIDAIGLGRWLLEREPVNAL